MSGFHFTETPPPMLLNTAMERENRITVPHVNHCAHPGKWVLDYSVTDCGLVKTEFTSWLPRPEESGTSIRRDADIMKISGKDRITGPHT